MFSKNQNKNKQNKPVENQKPLQRKSAHFATVRPSSTKLISPKFTKKSFFRLQGKIGAVETYSNLNLEQVSVPHNHLERCALEENEFPLRVLQSRLRLSRKAKLLFQKALFFYDDDFSDWILCKLVAIQIFRDLMNGDIPGSFDTITQFGALIAQGEFGDFSEASLEKFKKKYSYIPKPYLKVSSAQNQKNDQIEPNSSPKNTNTTLPSVMRKKSQKKSRSRSTSPFRINMFRTNKDEKNNQSVRPRFTSITEVDGESSTDVDKNEPNSKKSKNRSTSVGSPISKKSTKNISNENNTVDKVCEDQQNLSDTYEEEEEEEEEDIWSNVTHQKWQQLQGVNSPQSFKDAIRLAQNWPFYGTTRFRVKYDPRSTGHLKIPVEVELGIKETGILIFTTRLDVLIAYFKFDELESWKVFPSDFKIKTKSGEMYIFRTLSAYDIAKIIADYASNTLRKRSEMLKPTVPLQKNNSFFRRYLPHS